LIGLVWLGGALVLVGLVGGLLTLNRLASLRPEAFRDPAAQEYLRYARLFIGTMAIGAIVAVVSALRGRLAA
jgi:hypothetical protein